MTGSKLTKPRLPSHYLLRFEPPDASGDEALVITSERRRMKLKGRCFREFITEVVPLLDGRHTVEEISAQVAETFAAEDLVASLETLASHGFLEDEDVTAAGGNESLEPQLNFFHEAGMDPATAHKLLSAASVAVFGLGPLGTAVAMALAAAGVGHLRLIDGERVREADALLNPQIAPADAGERRTDVVGRRAAALAPRLNTLAFTNPLDSDDDVLSIVNGADFAVSCVDRSMSNVLYRLNRACHKTGLRWTSATVSAFEGVVGPTVTPSETACFLCYQMRAVACTENPEEEFAQLRFLDRRRQDDGARRENLVFGAGIVGNMVAAEVFRVLLGLPPGLPGRIAVMDFMDLTLNKHVVLRKPWCPVCFGPGGAAKRDN